MLLFFSLCAVTAGGCAALMRATTGSPASVGNGTWTGIVRTETVRDTADPNRTWSVAAMEIIDGPPLPNPPREPVMPARALLIITRERPLRILKPEDLGVPEGTRVRVRGTMTGSGGGVYAPPSADPAGRDVSNTIPIVPVDPSVGAVIGMRAKPQVLRD